MSIKRRLQRLEDKAPHTFPQAIIAFCNEEDDEATKAEKLAAAYEQAGLTPKPDDNVIFFRRVNCRRKPHDNDGRDLDHE
jgi:hypothetical protein